MEGASSVYGSIIEKGLHDFEDLQGTDFFQHGSMVQPQTESVFPLNVQYMQEQPISVIDRNDNERGKSLESDAYLRSCVVGSIDEHNEVGKRMGTPWQRIKWTEKKVKLLITAVSYIRQFESSLLQKIGKWKLVSEVMAERGYHVSPQQCEDKFNNLNKSYKRLIDVLGRGISCEVVENPKLLDEMDISEKAKLDVRKILSSKQLFYEEMCSFHNGNELHLPHDPDLQRSLQLALRKKDEYESQSWWSKAYDFDIQVQDAGADDKENEADFNKVINRDLEVVHPMKFVGFNGILHHPQENGTDLNHTFSKATNIDELRKKWMTFRACRLRAQRLQVKAQLLKLEKQQFEWQRICWKQDREMNKMRLENESLKIENERMAIELKFKRMSADYNLIV